MARILITGGAGFIGSHLSEELAAKHHDIIIYDNLSTGNIENIKTLPVRFVQDDILNTESLKRAMEGCEFVFHLAAGISVPESMTNPGKYVSLNVTGILNVLETARQQGLKKIVFSSSAAVYGDSPELPKREDMRPEPKSPYAITKLDGEYYCAMFSETYGLASARARFFNVFGERQDPKSPYAAAVPIFASRAFKGSPITIFGDGEQTRDFVYVKDVARALVFLMEHGEGLFNIGYGQSCTVNHLVKTILDYAGASSPLEYGAERPGEIRHSSSSVAKLTALGFKPTDSLESGLQKTIDWYRKIIQ